MLGSLILYLKGMRIVMFQLSGFYCRSPTDPSIQLRLQPSGSLRPKAGGGLCGLPGDPSRMVRARLRR